METLKEAVEEQIEAVEEKAEAALKSESVLADEDSAARAKREKRDNQTDKPLEEAQKSPDKATASSSVKGEQCAQ